MRKINNFHKSKPIVQNVKTNSVNEGKMPKPLTLNDDISDWNPGLTQDQINEAEGKGKDSKSSKSGKSGRASQNSIIANMTSMSALAVHRINVKAFTTKYNYYVKQAQELTKKMENSKSQEEAEDIANQYEVATDIASRLSKNMEDIGEKPFNKFPPLKMKEFKEEPKEENPLDKPKEDLGKKQENPYIPGTKEYVQWELENAKAGEKVKDDVAKNFKEAEEEEFNDLHRAAKARSAGEELGRKVVTYFNFRKCGTTTTFSTAFNLQLLGYPEIWEDTDGDKYVTIGSQQNIPLKGAAVLEDIKFWGSGRSEYGGPTGLSGCP